MTALQREIGEILKREPAQSIGARVRRALQSLSRGLEHGYPTCCIEAYAADILDGRKPYLDRGCVPLGERGAVYVPCPTCCEQIGRVVPLDEVPW